jgi:hypothetical protein
MPRLAFPPSALRALALRACVLWALVHALTVVALAMMQGADGVAAVASAPPRPNPLLVTVVSTLLLMVDVRRRCSRPCCRSLAADGCAVVVTGHEVPTLLGACDHVTWCTAGTTYELGPPAAARAHDSFRRDYLGPHGG